MTIIFTIMFPSLYFIPKPPPPQKKNSLIYIKKFSNRAERIKDYTQLKLKVNETPCGDTYSGKDQNTSKLPRYNTPPAFRAHMNPARMRRSCSANVLPSKPITAIAKLRAEARSPLTHISNTDYVVNSCSK